MRFSLGHKARLYYSTDGTTYNLVKGVKDLTLNLTKDEVDVTTRDNGGWKATAGSLKDASIEFQLLPRPNEASYEALRGAFMAETPLRFKVLSGPVATSGSEGLEAWCEVLGFNRSEALADAQMIDVTIKPTVPPVGDEAEVPAWGEETGV